MELRTLNDSALARSIAVEAGRLLMALRADVDCPDCDLGVRGDAEANRLILDRLRDARPDDFVLSEESADDRTRCSAERVWIIDPLDGTREFAERREDWAVHVGLAIGGVPRVGAVALPAIDRVFATDGGTVLPPRASRRPRIVVSRSRASDLCSRVATAVDGELVAMGSAGAKAMAVVAGDADIYLHSGGQYEWDNCAPAAVAMAAGLHASRIDGAPLVYNCVDPLLPDLLICRPEWAEPILAAIRD